MLEEVNIAQISNNEQPENTFEVTLAQFDALVEDKKALDRLLANPDFDRIINQRFLKDDGERLKDLLMSRNLGAVRERDTIVSKIVGKGYFQHFIEDMKTSLHEIDNPQNREELVRELEAYQFEEEKNAQ